MKTNFKAKTPVYTHEGALSTNVPAIQKLRRLTMACMLWEDNFYVDGKTVSEQIEEVCKEVSGQKITELALEVHEKGLLRHVPLWLLVQALKKGAKCQEAIVKICSRPDQMTELLSLYWKNGKKPLAAQLKKGLAKSFTKFDEYALQKYNRDSPIKLRDILFLSHAKPKDDEQAELWKRLISNQLKTPETWETKLSAGEDKKESFKELLEKSKMGKLAIVRNLKNMEESGVDKALVERELLKSKREILPFQYLTASRMCPRWEDIIDKAMVHSLQDREKLKGITVIVVDVSGSMDAVLSAKSDTKRMDAACGVAILLREICEGLDVFTFSDYLEFVAPRHGMALRDAIVGSQPHSGTHMGQALSVLMANLKNGLVVDRIIVVSDEQSHDTPPKMRCFKNCYMVNVGTYENGVKNNGEWLTISGFSEHIVDYIIEIEREQT